MKVLTVNNVNTAYQIIINDALEGESHWRRITPRGEQDTLEYVEPVCTVYKQPRQRVLFNPTRDANPFFHVMESLWMLHGRNDLEWIEQFNTQIGQFSDDGKFFNGAYGFRWREWFGVDQLYRIIDLLIKNPHSRRAVLAMWDVNDLGKDSKDIPCNTHVYFKIRDGRLNMTVCNRSNDVIWGCYGANYVHFSFLMEYVAAHVDVGIGVYTHVSDSFHIYENNPAFIRHKESQTRVTDYKLYTRISDREITPLIESLTSFDQDMALFFAKNDLWRSAVFYEPFFNNVALPMRWAWSSYKQKDRAMALSWAEKIKSPDWKYACLQWMARRLK